MRTRNEHPSPLRLLRPLLALAMLIAFDSAATTVWTWIDKDGVRHYSQTPGPGATRLEIGPSNRAVAHVPSTSLSPAVEPTRRETSVATEKYAEFSIARPGQDDAVVHTGGLVPVEIRVDPALRPGHALAFYLDDRQVTGVGASATSFELKDVPRGTHLLVAVVQDERRAVLQEAAVTFHVRQPSAIKPGPPKPVQPLPKQN
jgi:hypothetical protein